MIENELNFTSINFFQPNWNMKIYCSASIVALFKGCLCRALYNFSETPWPVSWKYVMSRYRWNFCIRFITAEIQICHDIVNIFHSLRIYTSIHVYGLIFNGKKRGGKKLSNHYFRIICNVKKGMRSKSEPKFKFILFLNIWVLYQRM